MTGIARSPLGTRLLPLAGVCLLALVPYRDFFGPRVPVGRDLLFYFYPLKAHLVEAVRSGEVPWIDRYRWGGTPLLGSPGAAAFDPGNVLFLLMPLGAAMKVWTLLRLVTAVAGFAFLSRRWGLSRGASAAAGLVYGLSGTSVSLTPFPSTFCAVSILPWYVAFLLDVRRSPRSGPLAGLAVATGLLILAGIPEFTFFAVVIAFFVFFERGATPPLGRALPAALAAGFAGVLLGAATILPALEIASRSVRGPGGGLGVKAAAMNSLPLVRLKEILGDGLLTDWTKAAMAPGVTQYPYMPSLTPGRVALVLAAAGVIARRVGRWRALGLVVFGLLLALGDATPFWILMARAIPLSTSIRFPEKYAVLAGFGLCWLAALGLAALEERMARFSTRLPRVALPLLALAVLIDRESIARGLSPTESPSVLDTRPPILAALPEPVRDAPPPRLFHKDSYAPVPAYDARDISRAARHGRESLVPAYASLFGAAYVFELDYDVSLPQSAFEWTRLLQRAVPLPGPLPMRFVRGSGVTAVVETDRGADGRWTPRLTPFAEPLPPYRFAARLAADGDGRRLFKRFLDEGFDPATAYVFEERASLGAPLSPGRILSVRDRADALDLDVEVAGPADAFLVLYRLKEATEDARLDGRAVPVHDVTFGFSGVTVPPGRHRLRLRPDTRWAKIGVLVSMLTALTLGGGLLVLRRR